MTLPLSGIRVVDVSQVAAVPMTARILADFGADVIHVENTITGDLFRWVLAGMETGIKSDVNYIWENYNRNKKSIAIDLSKEAGQKILHKILEKSDIFLTNMRPFELKKFNLEYEQLNNINARLICGFLNGFGKEGNEKNMPAFDHTGYWARSGIPHRLKSLTAKLQEPNAMLPAFVPSFGDHMAAMILVSGIMIALYNREKTGKGEEVHTSLFQAGVYQQAFDLSGSLVNGQDCVTLSSDEDWPNPLYWQYQTKDNRWLLFSVLNIDRYAEKVFKAIGREDLLDDPRFNTLEQLNANKLILMDLLKQIFMKKTLKEWKPLLTAAEVPYSPVQTHAEVINDPQARANDFFISYDHPDHGCVEGVANPIKLSHYPENVRMPAPAFSEHTDEVLLENGFSLEEITAFKEKDVIF
ncbi:MAG: CoA transferase [Deltaproteobacteria bacterium]|nr:CoA transferase [Deltaproteobacteria bacterium]